MVCAISPEFENLQTYDKFIFKVIYQPICTMLIKYFIVSVTNTNVCINFEELCSASNVFTKSKI